jgi:protein disulfide-isomerase A1
MLEFVEKFKRDWWSVLINTEEDLAAFLKEDDEPKVVTSMDAATLATVFDSIRYGYCRNNDVIPKESLRVYNDFDGELVFKEFEDGSIGDFILRHSIPYFIDVNSSAMKRAFDYSKKHVLLFHSKEGDQFVKKELLPVAKYHSPEYIFVTVPPTKNDVSDMFDVPRLPYVILVTMEYSKKRMRRFPMKESVSASAVFEHIDAHKNGDLKYLLKSEDHPTQEAGKPFRLVGNSFSEHVTSKNIIVKVYTTWCVHSQKLAPIWDELAVRFAGSELTVATFDDEANEHDDVNADKYPYLRLYKLGSEEPITYSGDNTLEAITQFLEGEGFSSKSDL